MSVRNRLSSSSLASAFVCCNTGFVRNAAWIAVQRAQRGHKDSKTAYQPQVQTSGSSKRAIDAGDVMPIRRLDEILRSQKTLNLLACPAGSGEWICRLREFRCCFALPIQTGNSVRQGRHTLPVQQSIPVQLTGCQKTLIEDPLFTPLDWIQHSAAIVQFAAKSTHKRVTARSW